MTKKTDLTLETVEALGSQTLAGLLFELASLNTDIKRRLKFMLSASTGIEQAAKEISKRLQSIKRAKSFIEWHKLREFTKKLESESQAIHTYIAPHDSAKAFQLMWDFLSLAANVYERCDDSNGHVSPIFRQALVDCGSLAKAAHIPQKQLIACILLADETNDYGEYDAIIEYFAPALGMDGLSTLREHYFALQAEPAPTKPANKKGKTIGISTNGAIDANDFKAENKKRRITSSLREIADAMGDVDGYIAQYSAKDRTNPYYALAIAKRLHDANRYDEALVALDAVIEPNSSHHLENLLQMRAQILVALKQTGAAQKCLWQAFEISLEPKNLRAIIGSLPDFEDFEAKLKSFAIAQKHEQVHQAIHFFLQWPNVEQLSILVQNRIAEVDGNHYELLVPASELLEAKYPLSATLLKRALIDFTLKNARATRYAHAARHLQECRSLSKVIEDYGAFPTHAAYENALKLAHSKKASFWDKLSH